MLLPLLFFSPFLIVHILLAPVTWFVKAPLFLLLPSYPILGFLYGQWLGKLSSNRWMRERE